LANSSQGRQAQPTSNDDLAALEREVIEYPEKWPVQAIALIQRLREAESAIAESRIPWRLAQAEDRIAALERVLQQIASSHPDFTDHPAMARAALAVVPTAHNNEAPNGK
jgi:hypothetical protein